MGGLSPMESASGPPGGESLMNEAHSHRGRVEEDGRDRLSQTCQQREPRMARERIGREGSNFSSVVTDSPGVSAINEEEAEEAPLQGGRARGWATGADRTTCNVEGAEPGERGGEAQPVGVVRRRIRGKTRSTQSAVAEGCREQRGEGCPGGAVRHPASVDGEMNTEKCTSLGRAERCAAAQAAEGNCASSAAGRPPSQTRTEG